MQIIKRRVILSALLSSVAIATPAFAQDNPPAKDEDEIVVTAQKREQNLQDVPISIQAIGEQKLDQLNISNFAQFTQQLPSVSFQTIQPGVTTVYMRGVASGGDGNHSGSLPSVGFYLDEQPITTIGGTLDVHIYDIARIESLSGPQGTLYGASSEAGTIRIITNKPEIGSFYGRADVELNQVEHGGVGGKAEAMLNIPISSMAALRVVGFYQRDAGYIDNVPGCRAFMPATNPLSCTPNNGGIGANNAAFVEKDYNDVQTWGGRAALKIDLDDNWTVTPTVMYQDSRSYGTFGSDPKVGDLQVQHFFPEWRKDRFIQAALTIEGKIGNWDLTYAGAYLDRKDSSSSDYTDYAEAYDSLYSSYGGIAGYFAFTNAAGNQIDPRQQVLGSDHFRKLSQELRLASPQDKPLRFVGGIFYQRQTNEIHQDYRVAGLDPLLSVNGLPGTLWLTQQHRVDRDYAAFGELSYDILSNLTFTAGGRYYKYDNSLIGFFGFGRNPTNGFSGSPPNAAFSNRTGVAQCFTQALERLYDRDTDTYSSSLVLLPPAVAGSPCTNLARVSGNGIVPVSTKDDGFLYRFNLTWKPSDDVLLYGTVSKGYRPGGINRRGTIPPYQADFLTNYELGWKTTLAGGHLRFNGAAYYQKWANFQFSFLGQNSFTEIHNGPNADIWGIEIDANYHVGGLTLSAAGAWTDAKTTQNLCAADDPTFTCATSFVAAPKGTRLPITPEFKANATARYDFKDGPIKWWLQGTAAYQSSASSDIRTAAIQTGTFVIVNPAALLGRLNDFVTADFSIGAKFGKFSLEAFLTNAFDERAEISRFQECGSCSQRPYVVYARPRTFGVRAGTSF